MASKKPKKSVSWLVCDCGCKGYSFSLGAEHYWLSPHTEDGKRGLILFKGHGYSGKYLELFEDFTTADNFVVDNLKSSGILEKLERDLRKAKLLLK